MAVKDFKVAEGQKAVVCNADGKMWRFGSPRMPKDVANQTVIGTDTFPNDLGEPILHIWVD